MAAENHGRAHGGRPGAIPGTAGGIFFNRGQTCCAGSRLFAHKKVFDQMVEGVSNLATSIKLGPGLDPKTEMGPLVSEEQSPA